ncbi:acyltransferase [Desulforhopalus singaporensis]|uniref:Hexapeptide repeat of succinyl-transferase n=1 Tax=Desulforhopalus singaporensis TaxID=91360 RepID=A0A1H0UXH8_9BACT|nr:acyltransferase [Desulforhopalus singaporensis]SDP70972.1 Hexapeptide repeat of succinyl-transferase [Desulforhopalus singaporensis]
MTNKIIPRKYNLSRIRAKFFSCLARKMPFIPGEMRAMIHSFTGVKFESASKTFVGEDVYFDSVRPQLITVGKGSRITEGAKILTHFLDQNFPDCSHFYEGSVSIGKDVFIGINVVIASPVSIGDGAIVGANAVVTKDIPANEVWGGIPAKFISNRESPVPV